RAPGLEAALLVGHRARPPAEYRPLPDLHGEARGMLLLRRTNRAAACSCRRVAPGRRGYARGRDFRDLHLRRVRSRAPRAGLSPGWANGPSLCGDGTRCRRKAREPAVHAFGGTRVRSQVGGRVMTATGRLKCQPGAEDRQEPLPFSAGLDGKRVATLLGLVRAYMLGNGWRSLGEIALALGRGSEAGIS